MDSLPHAQKQSDDLFWHRLLCQLQSDSNHRDRWLGANDQLDLFYHCYRFKAFDYSRSGNRQATYHYLDRGVVPKRPTAKLVIIGGGVIGAELASVYARIGTAVTVLEYADVLIPSMDRELGRELQKVHVKLDIDIRLSCKVQSALNK